ncbi:prophage tail fiber N-terminal domain-containing protein [Escherichia coli O153/O178:H19]
MSVVISGALIDGAGIPMSGCHIILKSRVNTSEVVMRTVADVVTGNCGEYCFKAQTGKYCVYLKQDWRDEYCVGDIAVYDDSKPGTLNDFLTALDEGDLKPDVVKRFEEMVAQAQQSAEAAAESERLAEQHVTDAQKIKDDCQTLANNVQQNTEAVAEDKKQVALLASSATQDAARAEQAVKDADRIVQEAVDKLGEAATLTGEAKVSAEAAAKSEQNAKQHRDEAQRIVDDLKGTNASTTQKGLVQLCSDTDNDSEELAATPKAVKAVMDETKTKAPLNSPALTGTPSTPTPPDDAAGNEIANAAFVRKLLAALVDSSPEALDTLNELAAALGNDPEFATTILNALAGKQPLNDVLTAISELTQRADNLLCFNQDGNASLSPLSEKARLLLAQTTAEDMLSVLELQKNTYSAQSDIYDRAEDKLALPGAFGFGYPFGKEDQLTFKNTSELTTWVTNAYPGRYAVTVPNQGTIIPGVYFTGILDVIWQMNQYETKPPSDAAKCIMFYAGNGDIWFNRYIYGRLVGWERIKISTADIYNVMGGTISNEWGDPDVGGLIIAAYQGTTDGDTKIKLVRGQYYAGSRLGPVGISAPYNPAGTYSSSPQFYVMGNAGHSLPGTYRALSGVTNTYGSDAMIGLFIRTA